VAVVCVMALTLTFEITGALVDVLHVKTVIE
jgi:hypothetical protein